MPYFECLYDKKKTNDIEFLILFSLIHSTLLLFTQHWLTPLPLHCFAPWTIIHCPLHWPFPQCQLQFRHPMFLNHRRAFIIPPTIPFSTLTSSVFFYRKCCTNTNIQIAGPKTFTRRDEDALWTELSIPAFPALSVLQALPKCSQLSELFKNKLRS